MRKKKRKNYIIPAIILIFIGLIFYTGLKFAEKPEYIPERPIEIPKRSTIKNTIELMNGEGVLKPGWLFSLSAKIISVTTGKKIYAGYYSIPAGLNNYEILKGLFILSRLNVARVTFPEGITIDKFAGLLERKAMIDSAQFTRLCKSRKILDEYGIKGSSVEGYLMPDTYQFFKKQNPEEALRKMLDAAKHIWDTKFSEKARESGMSRQETLSLAAIIEAETPVPDERERVSGVYRNRLNKGMLLQADPTVQYAIGEKRKLTLRDLSYDSPYNTYVYHGLPPSPINSPGVRSIEAALNPEHHDFIYFCAVGDGSGRHNFSRTALQHNINKTEFHRNLRKLKENGSK